MKIHETICDGDHFTKLKGESDYTHGKTRIDGNYHHNRCTVVHKRMRTFRQLLMNTISIRKGAVQLI